MPSRYIYRGWNDGRTNGEPNTMSLRISLKVCVKERLYFNATFVKYG